MALTAPIRNDHDIQTAVQDELEWTPDLDAAGIGVAIEEGTVSLSGEVATYFQRFAATRAALRVQGVRALVDNITVNSKNHYEQTETDLAKSVQRALEWSNGVPASVKAELTGRIVTLTGEVQWDFERQSARRAVEQLAGIGYIENRISLRPRPSDTAAAAHIKAALARDGSLSSTEIVIHVEGTTAKLTGSVHTWSQRRTAEKIAWCSPHITHLENRIVVSWF